MNAFDALLTGLVDYAGLFPPASQEMSVAMESYAAYLASSEREILGRFILPLDRAGEFEMSAPRYLPTGPESEPWRLSAIVGDINGAAKKIISFNKRHRPISDHGHAVIEVVELKAQKPDEITTRVKAVGANVTVYVETPLGPGVKHFISAVAAAGARAKVRTGGVTTDAFPGARDIAAFLIACKEANVAFKATAGLHHPLRGSYRLTYEPGSAEGVMYGYLNVFVAAAMVCRDAPEAQIISILEERDPAAFSFSDTSLEWRGIQIGADELHNVRENFANSFGSCSFREPVDEIRELTSISHQ